MSSWNAQDPGALRCWSRTSNIKCYYNSRLKRVKQLFWLATFIFCNNIYNRGTKIHFQVTTIYHTFSISPVSDLSLDWVVYNNSCFPDSHLARWDQNVWRRMRILHTFYVIIFLINLTWAVSVVALAPQPRRLAVRLGGEELVWGSSVFAVIPGASGNQFYNPLIIYSVSPFKSQLL